jgi:hypothetical protein
LEVSREALGEAMGLAHGYANGLLAPNGRRRLGPLSFELMLGALGLALVVVEDLEALQRIRPMLPKRRSEQVRMPKPVQQSGRAMLRKRLKALGRKGGRMSAAARMHKLTREQRSSIARVAVQARWKPENR